MNKVGTLMLAAGTQTWVVLSYQQVLLSLQLWLFLGFFFFLFMHLKLGSNKGRGEGAEVFCFHMMETNACMLSVVPFGQVG